MAKEQFNTPPAGGNVFTPSTSDKSDKAVLDTPTNPATLSPLSDADEATKEEVLSQPTGQLPAVEAIEKGDTDILNKVCAMCGWHHENKDIVEVTDDDKTKFVLAALSGQRFTRTYERFGGRMKITMRSRTYAETEMIGTQIERWRIKDNLQTMSLMYIKNWTYNLLVGLAAVEVEDKEPTIYPEISTKIPEPKAAAEGEEPVEMPTPLEIAEEKLLSDWNEATYSVIQNVSRHFDQMVQHLTLRAHDPDFWKETATPA